MGTPTIFTQTPIESVIISYGLKMQETLAGILLGTPLFKAIAIFFIIFVLIHSYLKMFKGEMNQAALISKVVFQIFLYVIAFSLLGQGTSGVKFGSASENRNWSSYSKISSDPKFSSLENESSGLSWYLIIYRSFQGFSNIITDTLSSALQDQSMSKDPSFLYKTIGKAAAKGLDDPQTAISFNALLRDCSDTKSGKILDQNSSLKDMFDLTKPGCGLEWSNFKANLNRIMDIYKNAYSSQIYADIYAGQLKGMDSTTLANLATANAIMTHIHTLSGDTSGINVTNNVEATYSDKKSDQFALLLDNPIRNTAAYLVNMLGISDKDAFATLNKAEISTVFNQVAYLIPVIRAIFQVCLALAFLFVILALACGFYKVFTSWLASMFLISMYQPISVLIYKLPVFFANQSAFLNNSKLVSSDPLLIVGAKLLDDQIVQLQTVCIALQIIAFMLFLFGSVKALGSFNHISGKFGASISSYGERAISGIASLGHTKISTSTSVPSDIPTTKT